MEEGDWEEVTEDNLVDILSLFSANNTDDVMYATRSLRKFLSHPDSIVLLLDVAWNNQDPRARTISLTLIRKKVIGHWMRFDKAFKSQIKETLIEILSNTEEESIVLRAAAEVTALIAKHELPEGRWDSLLENLQSMCDSDMVSLRLMGLHVLVDLVDNIRLFMTEYFDDVLDIFTNALNDPNVKIRTEALNGFARIMRLVEDEERAAKFRNVLDIVVNLINEELLDNGNEDIAILALQALDELTEHGQIILQGDNTVVDLVEYMLDIGDEASLDSQVRQQALSFVFNVLQFNTTAIYKNDLVERTLEVSLALACEEEDEDSIDLSNAKFGCQMTDMVLVNIPTRFTLDILIDFIESNIGSSNVWERSGAINIMSVSAQGLSEEYKPNLDKLLDWVAQGMDDESRHVVAASCMAVSELTEWCEPEIGDYHEKVVPLIQEMIQIEDDEIVALALAALSKLMECLKGEAGEYMDDLLPACIDIVKSADVGVLAEGALSTMAGFACAVSKDFRKYGDEVMQICLSYMELEDDDHLEMRVTATECAGLVASAIGRDAAEQYLDDMIDLGIQGCTLEYHKLREMTYGMFSNVAEVLEEDYVDYVGKTLPLTIAAIMSADGYTEEDYAMGGGISDDEQAGTEINTPRFIALEKASAVVHMGMLAKYMGEAFADYYERVLNAVEMMVSYHAEDVRMCVVPTYTRLLEWALNMDPMTEEWTPGFPAQVFPSDAVSELLQSAVPAWVSYALGDEDMETVARSHEALTACMKDIGPAAVQDHYDSMVDAFEMALQREHPCYEYIDYDEDEPEHDPYVIDAAVDCMVWFARVGGVSVVDDLDERLFPALMEYVKPHYDEADKYMAIAAVSDITVELGEDTPRLGEMLESIMNEVGETDSDKILHNGSFTIGVLASELGKSNNEVLQMALDLLRPIYDRTTNEGVHDNVCGAVARIIMAGVEHVDLDSTIDLLLRGAPLRVDFAEQEALFNSIFFMFKEVEMDALAEHMPGIFDLFGRVIMIQEEEVMPESIRLEILGLMVALLESEEISEGVQEIISSLEDEPRGNLEEMIEFARKEQE